MPAPGSRDREHWLRKLDALILLGLRSKLRRHRLAKSRATKAKTASPEADVRAALAAATMRAIVATIGSKPNRLLKKSGLGAI